MAIARHEAGYTLAELVVAMLIFSIVMTLITVSFNRIVASSAQIVKSADTDIGGLIGLELLRGDLELAGFGLPWSLPTGVSYSEAPDRVLVTGCQDGCPNADAIKFNDAPLSAPRAVVVGDNVGYNGSDYLILKGTALGMNATSRSWSYLNYSSVGAVIKPSKSEVELKSGNGDRVIVLKNGVSGGVATRELVTDGGAFTLVFNQTFPQAFLPTSVLDSYLVYGVAPADSSGRALSFPFNRADYYIARPDEMSITCAPGTGVLYKSILNQNWTTKPYEYYPILDCVADLQVIFFLDSNGDGKVDAHLHDLSGYSPSDIRGQVQEIRVYILAQQGRKDLSYLYPVSDPNKVIVVGDPDLDQALGTVLGSVWTQSALANAFGPDWRNYHWKVFTIVVQPHNL